MMTINSKTKISRIIKENKDAIEVLASLAKPFEKLRNPLLRKVLAGRATVKEAAKIGGCEVSKIAEALKPLGFEFTEEDKNSVHENGASASLPAFMQNVDQYPKRVVDVRADLAEGKDPLKKIMAEVKTLSEGSVLQLINSFEPTPLINLLGKKGYECYVQEKGPDEVHTWFKLKSAIESGQISDETPETVDEATFKETLSGFGEKFQEVNVSQMEMPMPMVTILESLEQLPEEYALSVFHKRIPVFLFSELRDRKFNYLLHQAGDNDVRLLIYR